MRLLAFLLLLSPHMAKAADARLMLDIMRCESGFDSRAVGDDGVSQGIAQFRRETFFEFAKLAKKQGLWPTEWKPAWRNSQQQVFLLEWGLDNGYANRWTCYRMLMEKTSRIKR